MTDIAASDVTYTEVSGAKSLVGMPPLTHNRVSLAFGDNTLTYPTNGIPLTTSKLGVTNLLTLNVLDQGSNAKGYKFEWDSTNNKLRVMVEQAVATNTPLGEHTHATFAPNPATVIVEITGF